MPNDNWSGVTDEAVDEASRYLSKEGKAIIQKYMISVYQSDEWKKLKDTIQKDGTLSTVWGAAQWISEKK